MIRNNGKVCKFRQTFVVYLFVVNNVLRDVSFKKTCKLWSRICQQSCWRWTVFCISLNIFRGIKKSDRTVPIYLTLLRKTRRFPQRRSHPNKWQIRKDPADPFIAKTFVFSLTKRIIHRFENSVALKFLVWILKVSWAFQYSASMATQFWREASRMFWGSSNFFQYVVSGHQSSIS